MQYNVSLACTAKPTALDQAFCSAIETVATATTTALPTRVPSCDNRVSSSQTATGICAPFKADTWVLTQLAIAMIVAMYSPRSRLFLGWCKSMFGVAKGLEVVIRLFALVVSGLAWVTGVGMAGLTLYCKDTISVPAICLAVVLAYSSLHACVDEAPKLRDAFVDWAVDWVVARLQLV